jgi:hypothetical protein
MPWGRQRHPNTELATGHDSPTSILCLQCPSRVLLFLPSPAWTSARRDAQIRGPMGLNDHRELLQQAEHRVEQVKVSL